MDAFANIGTAEIFLDLNLPTYFHEKTRLIEFKGDPVSEKERIINFRARPNSEKLVITLLPSEAFLKASINDRTLKKEIFQNFKNYKNYEKKAAKIVNIDT
jgi:hypothetical protein